MNRMRYPEEKLTLRFTLAFLLGFFAALLVSWCGREYYLQKAGLISDFYLRQLKYKNLEGRRLFGSFLGGRRFFRGYFFWGRRSLLCSWWAAGLDLPSVWL